MPVNVCSIKLSEPKYCRPSSLRWSLTQMADRNENGNYKNYKHNLQENWKGVCLRRQQWGTAKERVRRQRVLWLLCEEGRGCCLERECLRGELLPHPCSQDGSGFMSGALVVPSLFYCVPSQPRPAPQLVKHGVMSRSAKAQMPLA